MGKEFIKIRCSSLLLGSAVAACDCSLAVRKNKVTFPLSNFSFLHNISPPPMKASSINFSARSIQLAVGESLVALPMKRVSMTRSRSFRRSDLRSGKSFLDPCVHEFGL